MTTSEPPTGEIVRALRFCYESEGIECYECPCRVSGGAYLCHMDRLADRLESQERDNETMRGNNFDATSVTNVLAYLDTVMGLIHCADGIKDLIVSMQGTSEELTARAEQAEKKNAELINKITKLEGGTWT